MIGRNAFFLSPIHADLTPPNTQQNCNNTPTQVPTRKGARLSELEPWRYPSGDSNVRVVWFGLCHAHTRPAQSFFVSHPYPHTNQTNTTPQHTQPPPFLPSAFGKALLVAPVQPLRRLQLTWVVPFKARFIQIHVFFLHGRQSNNHLTNNPPPQNPTHILKQPTTTGRRRAPALAGRQARVLCLSPARARGGRCVLCFDVVGMVGLGFDLYAHDVRPSTSPTQTRQKRSM